MTSIRVHPTISPILTNLAYATLATPSANTCNSIHTSFSDQAQSGFYPLMSLPPTGFASDFQSNGQVKVENTAVCTPSVTGLGIRYFNRSGFYVESSLKRPSFPVGVPTTAAHSRTFGEHASLDCTGISHTGLPPVDMSIGDGPSSASNFYLGQRGTTHPTSNFDDSWPFSSLSDVTAYSTDSSVDEGFVVSNANVEMDGGEHAVSNHDLFNASMAITPPMAGPFLDINMFEQSLFAQEPSACVNPIDTIDARLYAQDDDPDSPCPPSSSTLPENSTPLDALSMEAIDRIVSVLTTSAARGDSQESCVPVSLHHVDVPDHNVLSNPSVRAIGIESAHHIMSPKIIISTPTSSPFPSPQRQVTARPKNATRSYVQKKSVSLNEDVCRSVPTIPGTPVLDAHHGIELVDLLEKAERYRLRNPGQDLSKKWLAAFAGKLSTMGELLDDFRCYVIGCSQTNKRRDHILIHVGSHVDQRPFPCGFCPMRFLRKNEWKRHEASHTGEKPFICNLCQFEKKAFVRQDLLSQHMRRTHGIDPSANKENGQRPRKKPKLGY